MKWSHETLNDQLSKSLKFSNKDLDANRDGIITRAQYNNARRAQQGVPELILLLTLVYAGIFILLNDSIIKSWGIFIVVTALALVLFRWRTVWLLNRAQIAKTHGIVHLEHKPHPKDPQYHIVMPDKRFSFGEFKYSGFVEGDLYTLYYLPDLNHLLSAEHHESELVTQQTETGK